ncbi:MAG: rod shape-determining protein MreC [Pseudomonadota bacterium]
MRETGAGYLFSGLALLSVVLLVLELSTRLLTPMRENLATLVSPIYMLAEAPYSIAGVVDTFTSSHEDLRAQNARLQRRVLELAQISQQYVALRAENDRMRELLGSQSRLPYDVLVAELVGIVPDADTHQVMLDKGRDAGLEPGLAVVDAHGLFGQIVEVGAFTSRVLLITDANHAVPVRVNRNGVRSIAGGTGERAQLLLEDVPISADIVDGDVLETSGLGGRFPPGYPVGVVQSMLVSPTSTFAEVTIRPIAQLDRSRHVLVIFQIESTSGAGP